MADGLAIRIKRDGKDKVWSWFDDLFMDKYAKYFGPIGTNVYFNLCRRVDKNQRCFPSQKRIAGDIGAKPRAVGNFIYWLIYYHIISCSRERFNGKWKNNVYTLLDKSVWILPKARITSGTKRVRRNIPEAIKYKNWRHTIPTKNIHIKNYINKDPPSEEAIELKKNIKELAESKKVNYENKNN